MTRLSAYYNKLYYGKLCLTPRWKGEDGVALSARSSVCSRR
jgi:hypothetical protein